MSIKLQATVENEIDLDPKDWNSFRELGHQIIEDITDFYEGISDKPVWSEVQDDNKNQF